MKQHLKDDIRHAEDEVLGKIETSVNYDRHLFHPVKIQFRESVKCVLSKSSQASFTCLNSLSTYSTSDILAIRLKLYPEFHQKTPHAGPGVE